MVTVHGGGGADEIWVELVNGILVDKMDHGVGRGSLVCVCVCECGVW